SMPVTSPPQRESTQNPPPQNVTLGFFYDLVGNVKQATDGRGIRTDYEINALNQVVQITHAAASSAPGAPAFSYREQFTYDANNNVVDHKTERRDDDSPTQVNRWITVHTVYDRLDRKLSETVTTDDTPAI